MEVVNIIFHEMLSLFSQRYCQTFFSNPEREINVLECCFSYFLLPSGFQNIPHELNVSVLRDAPNPRAIFASKVNCGIVVILLLFNPIKDIEINTV